MRVLFVAASQHSGKALCGICKLAVYLQFINLHLTFTKKNFKPLCFEQHKMTKFSQTTPNQIFNKGSQMKDTFFFILKIDRNAISKAIL